jgi:hypothetical protein
MSASTRAMSICTVINVSPSLLKVEEVASYLIRLGVPSPAHKAAITPASRVKV